MDHGNTETCIKDSVVQLRVCGNWGIRDVSHGKVTVISDTQI